jgi:hypothetical protein
MKLWSGAYYAEQEKMEALKKAGTFGCLMKWAWSAAPQKAHLGESLAAHCRMSEAWRAPQRPIAKLTVNFDKKMFRGHPACLRGTSDKIRQKHNREVQEANQWSSCRGKAGDITADAGSSIQCAPRSATRDSN